MNWALALVLAVASTYQASSPLAPTLRALSPAPGQTLKAFFPRVSATIVTHGVPLRRQSLRVYLDGHDITPAVAAQGDTVEYIPRNHLQAGWHDVFLEGTDTANHSFSEAWVFETQDPDIDVPIDDDNFAFLPVGMDQGPFTHFFLVSPFDGFGLLQLCGFEFPLSRAIGTPVFFVTVPVTLGTVLAGCNPGLVFTPFQAGIGDLSPIFFPIAAAGPGSFTNGNPHRRRPLNPPITMPVYGNAPGTPVYRKAPGMPIYRTAPGMPIYRTAPGMPVYRAPGMPVYGTPVIGVPHAPVIGVPRAGIPHAVSAPPHPAGVPHPH